MKIHDFRRCTEPEEAAHLVEFEHEHPAERAHAQESIYHITRQTMLAHELEVVPLVAPVKRNNGKSFACGA